MTRILLRRLTIGLLVLLAAAGLGGCGWRGVNSIPLPGTKGGGPGSYVVQAQMPDVTNIQPNSRVRVGDVTVGNVMKIERQGWHALITMRLAGDVHLPANATAKIGQTSLLGTLHIELAPPTDVPPEGRLHDGSLIPLSSAGAYPTTEQTLAAVSLVLNGGGIGQIQDITKAFSTAFRGREQDLRSLIQQLDKFASYVNDQTGDIIAASDSLNRLVGKFADQKPVLDRALRTVPDALATLNDERDNLAEALDQLGKFSALAADSVNQTKGALVEELKNLGPVVESLANAGPALTRSLSALATYPFPNETLQNWFRGDYANLTAIIDLTLSRIDQSYFTGTRFECHLTQIELQWGRTIGQFPSPCTAGTPYVPGNPLTIPYHWDQGP
jgi:phospholipid/cholesterol/gamma-HCH transport system substrate-binding protein